MAQNQGQLWIRQFAIDDMKIGPAHCACRNAHEQLSPPRIRFWHIAQLQWLLRLIEDHRAHRFNVNDER
jgi:hypothetical protein